MDPHQSPHNHSLNWAIVTQSPPESSWVSTDRLWDTAGQQAFVLRKQSEAHTHSLCLMRGSLSLYTIKYKDFSLVHAYGCYAVWADMAEESEIMNAKQLVWFLGTDLGRAVISLHL